MTRTPALLFDMDGVLIDSNPTHTVAWERYLVSHGIDPTDVGARMMGRHNPEIVRDLFAGLELTEEAVFAHGARKEALYRELMDSIFESKLVPGVMDFIARRREHPMAVATNAEAANVEFVLAKAGLGDTFGAIVNGNDVSHPKPAPDVYLRAASLLGVAPEDCIVFEDSLTGVRAGLAAGMRVVGVATSIPSFEDVDLTIIDFHDPRLEPWLARQ